MAQWKTIKEIEKIQPEGLNELGLPKAAYYVIHYEDGTTQEADFISEHDEEDFDECEDEDYEPKSEKEILESFRGAVRDLKLSMEGKVKFQPIENLFADSCMTKKEVLQDLDESFKLAKQVKDGKVSGRPAWELLSEL